VNAQILAVVVLAAFLAVVVCSLFGAVDAWLRKRNPPGPDVGVDIVDCGMVHDCDGCDECGAPMVVGESYELPPIEEDPLAIRLGLVADPDDVKLTALGYARYADRTVHRRCLAARRDGREPCYFCAPVLAGAS